MEDKYSHIPYVTPRLYVTLDSGINAQFSPEIEKMLEEAYLTCEIFVVCKNLRHARWIMDRCLCVLNWPTSTKAFHPQLTIVCGHETIKFISQEQLDILCTGRHRTQVIYGFDVEKALDRYEKEKKK